MYERDGEDARRAATIDAARDGPEDGAAGTSRTRFARTRERSIGTWFAETRTALRRRSTPAAGAWTR